MGRFKGRLVAVLATMALTVPLWTSGGAAQGTTPTHPTRVLIVLFDQMIPQYANQFDMPNFRSLRDAGTNFKNAYLGYMASETVIAHNVITSGQLPKHMGWTDEAYRDADNLFGKGAGAMHITGDLSLADFSTLINHEGYPKIAGLPARAVYPNKKFIVVGEKSYAVESAIAPSTADIAVRLSSRSASSSSVPVDTCRDLLGGRYRYPRGLNVPAYLTGATTSPPNPSCTRFYVNSDSGNSYGTATTLPRRCTPRTATGSSRAPTLRR